MLLEPVDRNTDADWAELGRSQPYWGVLSHPDFLSENITPDRIETFYATGRDYIGQIAALLERHTGARPQGRALDFGCGVGRLAEAMTEFASDVTGVDISPGMLALARGRDKGVTYVDAPPAGPFDWINTFIVLQHIPPERGLAIIEDLLSRLAPGGQISLQVTIWRDARHEYQPKRSGFLGRRAEAIQRRILKERPVGQIFMYDYDLSKVMRLVNRAGIEEASLVSTDHDGHHGVIILGRKAAPVTSS